MADGNRSSIYSRLALIGETSLKWTNHFGFDPSFWRWFRLILPLIPLGVGLDVNFSTLSERSAGNSFRMGT